MKRFITQKRLGVVLVWAFFFLNAAWGGGLSPQEVVLKYYRALQKGDFLGASQYISRGMLAGKDRKVWAEEMKALFEDAKVEITEISVSPGEVSRQEAQVNSIMTSKDIFNKSGLVEYNLEHLVLEDGLWKIERTELKDSRIIEP